MNTNFEKRKRRLLIGILGCPLFTLVLAHIVNFNPVLDQFTGAFGSMGHLLMPGMVWYCVRKEPKVHL